MWWTSPCFAARKLTRCSPLGRWRSQLNGSSSFSGVSVEAESAVAGSLCRLASAVDGRIVGDDIDRAWSFALCSLRLAALRTTLSFCLA